MLSVLDTFAAALSGPTNVQRERRADFVCFQHIFLHENQQGLETKPLEDVFPVESGGISMSMAVSSRRRHRSTRRRHCTCVMHVTWSGSKCSMVVAIVSAWPDGSLGFSAAGVGISGLGDGTCSVADGAGGC